MKHPTQDGVDDAVEQLASTFREKARETADSWRQVPLLAMLANGRDGWDPRLTTVVIDREWPMEDLLKIEPGLRIELHGGVVGAYPIRERAEVDRRILAVAAEKDHRLAEWDGSAALERLARQAAEPLEKGTDSIRAIDRDWTQQMGQYRLGLLEGWEQLTGPLYRVSDTLVRLAPGWHNSFSELLASALALEGPAPELDGLAVLRPSVRNALPRY